MISSWALKHHFFKKIGPRRPSHFLIFIFLVSTAYGALLSIKLDQITGELAAKTLASQKERKETIDIVPAPTFTPAPTKKPTPTPATVKKTASDNNVKTWGVSRQIDKYTWTMQIQPDSSMATADEILTALNNYRKNKGAGTLTMDDKLRNFAIGRAKTYESLGKLDGHTGFSSYFSDFQHLRDIGFMGVGENSSFGYNMEAVHLVEWVFAGDAPHDNNQKDPSWTHVGIGVAGPAVDIVFGKNKL